MPNEKYDRYAVFPDPYELLAKPTILTQKTPDFWSRVFSCLKHD